MTNEYLINELYKLGPLPGDIDLVTEDFPLTEFEELLDQFQVPVTESEAIKLIRLSPPVGTGCHGVEWTLLHLIETVDDDKLQHVLDSSDDNELKRLMQIRLDNYNNNKSIHTSHRN